MDHLRPVQPVTVFQAAFDQLSALLAGDAFAPGDRLPSERELAERLRVSRPSVREALKALRVLGMVEVRGRSTYVKGGTRAGQVALVLPLEEVELLEIHELREAIETQIAALAAERRDAHDLDQLTRVADEMAAITREDAAAFAGADRRFHEALARAARSRLLLAAQTQIYERALERPRLQSASLHAGMVAGARQRSVDAHRQIVLAVRQQDGAKARRLMVEHLGHVRQDIVVGAFGYVADGNSREAAPE